MTMIHFSDNYDREPRHPLSPERIGPEGLLDRLYRLLDEEAPAVRGAQRELAMALADAESGRSRSY